MLGRVVLSAMVMLLVAGGVAGAGESPWDGPPAAPLPDGAMFEDPIFQASVAQAVARVQAVEAQRGSAAAVAARVASRSAFDGLDGGAALALAQREFPVLMVGESDALGLSVGDRVVGFRRGLLRRSLTGMAIGR